jgi:hypothetical protein
LWLFGDRPSYGAPHKKAGKNVTFRLAVLAVAVTIWSAAGLVGVAADPQRLPAKFSIPEFSAIVQDVVSGAAASAILGHDRQ